MEQVARRHLVHVCHCHLPEKQHLQKGSYPDYDQLKGAALGANPGQSWVAEP